MLLMQHFGEEIIRECILKWLDEEGKNDVVLLTVVSILELNLFWTFLLLLQIMPFLAADVYQSNLTRTFNPVTWIKILISN